MASYIWQGGSPNNLNWSTAGNWLYLPAGQTEYATATAAPGTSDDVKFNGTGVPIEGGGTAIKDSTVDQDFVGPIKSLTVEAAYTKTITLNKNLIVDGSNNPTSTIAGGTIAGGNTLTFQATQGGPGTLNWNAGTIAVNTTVADTVALNMTTTADRKLIARTFTIEECGESSQPVTWSDEGSLTLSLEAAFVLGAGRSMTISSAVTVDGTSDEKFWVFGDMTAAAPAGNQINFKARLNDFGTIDVTQGNLRVRTFQDSGTLTVANGSTALLGDNASDIRFIVLPDQTNRSEINGTGTVQFQSGSKVYLRSTAGTPVKFAAATIYDSSTQTDTDGVVGNVEISGIYYWNGFGTGTWKGAGTTTVKAGASQLWLNGDDLTIQQRTVENNATINWQRQLFQAPIVPPKLTLTGTLNNQAGALFDVKMTAVNGNFPTVEMAGDTGTINNRGLFQNFSQTNVIVRPKYNPINGGRLNEKNPGFAVPGIPGMLFYFKALRFTQLVSSADGIFDVEQNTALVFEAGFDQSGGEITSVGGVGVAVAWNMSGGTGTFSGNFEDKSFHGEKVVQSGGSVTNGYRFLVDEEYELSNGTLDSEIMTEDPVYFAANSVDQSGGSHTYWGEVDVTAGYLLTAGTVTNYLGESNETKFTADFVDQTGGEFTLSNYYATFDVTGAYTFAGGESYVTPFWSEIYTVHFGELIVEAPEFYLSGNVSVDDGVYVASGGELNLVNMSEGPDIVVGDITVDGTLILQALVTVDGNVINNALVKLAVYTSWLGDTVTIDGNYTQASSGTLQILGGVGETAHLDVTETATLAGVLDVSAQGGEGVVMTYGARSGTFDSLIAPPESELVIWYDEPAGSLGIRNDNPT